MLYRYLTFSSLTILIGFTLSCDTSSKAPSIEEIRVDYLIDNTTNISVNPENKDYSDLELLGTAIGDSRVVTLGEATHGEGNVFQAKGRVVEYLIQEKGFEVVVFESPLYDVHRAMFTIQHGGNIQENLNSSIGNIWTNADEFSYMMELLETHLQQGSVYLAGLDTIFGGLASQYFINDLKYILSGSSIDMNSTDWNTFERLLEELFSNSWQDATISDIDKSTFDQVLNEIQMTDLSSFWQQMMMSLKEETNRLWIHKNGGINNAVGGLRDLQMGRNLIWIAEELYPDKKIIVWAANIHNARDMSGVIALEDPDYSFADFETMGKVAGNHFGEDLYVLSFTGWDGEWARWFDNSPTSVQASSEGSIEHLLWKTERVNTFIDLRSLPVEGLWLNERLLAKPFGYVELEAKWPEVTDGFFFIRSITPASQKN